MMEDILMGQESQQFRRKNNRYKYALVCVTLSVAAAIAVGLLMWGSKSAATSQAAEPFLGSAEYCGTCRIIPGVDTYKMCDTCYTPFDDTMRLTCKEDEALIVTSVKSDHNKHRAKDISLIYNECRDNQFENGGVCEFNLLTLREDFGDSYVQPDESTDEHKGEYKVYYTCVSDSLFMYPVDDPEVEFTETEEEYIPEPENLTEETAETEYSLSKVRWNDFELENFPVLSSALVKCDSSKAITESWDKAKVCVTDRTAPVILGCDDTRTDVRILVAKVKTTGTTVGLDKKLRKNLAKRATNSCADDMSTDSSATSCSVSFETLFQEGETLPEEGAQLTFTYLCSYSPEAVV